MDKEKIVYKCCDEICKRIKASFPFATEFSNVLNGIKFDKSVSAAIDEATEELQDDLTEVKQNLDQVTIERDDFENEDCNKAIHIDELLEKIAELEDE